VAFDGRLRLRARVDSEDRDVLGLILDHGFWDFALRH
jgi:hypothetical protein